MVRNRKKNVEKRGGRDTASTCRRQRTRLLDINGSLRVLRPGLIVIAPLLTKRALPPREYLASGAAVIVIRYRHALSAKLELGTGVCEGGAASIAGKLALYCRLVLPRSAVQLNSTERSEEFFPTSDENKNYGYTLIKATLK